MPIYILYKLLLDLSNSTTGSSGTTQRFVGCGHGGLADILYDSRGHSIGFCRSRLLVFDIK